MPDATCKTCKHWMRYDWQPITQPPQCNKLAYGGIYPILRVANGVFKSDSPLITPEDFGCIHHEPKPTAILGELNRQLPNCPDANRNVAALINTLHHETKG